MIKAYTNEGLAMLTEAATLGGEIRIVGSKLTTSSITLSDIQQMDWDYYDDVNPEFNDCVITTRMNGNTYSVDLDLSSPTGSPGSKVRCVLLLAELTGTQFPLLGVCYEDSEAPVAPLNGSTGHLIIRLNLSAVNSSGVIAVTESYTATKADLSNYVGLTGTQTITGTKTFNTLRIVSGSAQSLLPYTAAATVGSSNSRFSSVYTSTLDVSYIKSPDSTKRMVVSSDSTSVILQSDTSSKFKIGEDQRTYLAAASGSFGRYTGSEQLGEVADSPLQVYYDDRYIFIGPNYNGELGILPKDSTGSLGDPDYMFWDAFVRHVYTDHLTITAEGASSTSTQMLVEGKSVFKSSAGSSALVVDKSSGNEMGIRPNVDSTCEIGSPTYKLASVSTTSLLVSSSDVNSIANMESGVKITGLSNSSKIVIDSLGSGDTPTKVGENISTGSEVTIRPNISDYGYIGTKYHPFYRSYINNMITQNITMKSDDGEQSLKDFILSQITDEVMVSILSRLFNNGSVSYVRFTHDNHTFTMVRGTVIKAGVSSVRTVFLCGVDGSTIAPTSESYKLLTPVNVENNGAGYGASHVALAIKVV